MMDFDNILDIASQNQGLSSVQPKRYSLQAGPPKKDPKSRAVNPAAVQALLKKQQVDSRKREIEMKKEKEKLNAKRVEMKSDRKARAMASRTKDNFKGYNGVPLVELPKKRRSKQDTEDDKSMGAGFRNDSADPEDDEDNYEYDQTDSEPEPEPLRPERPTAVSRGASGSGNKAALKKNKPAPPPLNFADLLKLAEKKQFEPVDLKPKAMKKEERLRTAEEIRELEMERKVKKPEKNRDGQSQSRTSASEKEQKNGRPQKSSLDKQSLPAGSGKKLQSDRGHSSSKSSVRDGDRPKTSHSDKDRSKANVSLTSSGATNSKVLSKTSSQGLTKPRAPKPTSSHRSSTSSDLRKESTASLQGRAAGISGTRPSGTASPGFKPPQGSSQQPRPSQGGSMKQGAPVGGHRSGKAEPIKTGMNSTVKANGNPAMRSPAGGPPKAGSHPQQRPGATLQAKGGAPPTRPGGSGALGHPRGHAPRPPGPGRGRPATGGPVPGCSTGMMGSGPGRPKCTVVAETISSKNFSGPRPGVPARPGMPPRPGMQPRAMMNRPPGSMLPPITSAYKRRYEEEEDDYDSEMDDFIDDGGNEQQEISRHIKEIFGYDRNKYKDESDYALRFMESSWKDMQKEEARSLKMAVLEDLEEEKKEQEELKRKIPKRPKKN